MKNRVLIHVDSLRRDAATCITLGHILRARGIETVISGQQTTAHYLKYWRPHLMFHTAASKIANYHRLGIFSPDNRPLIHYLPQEGRPTRPESVNISYEPLRATGFRLVDRIYVWNKVHYDWLMKHAPLSPEQVRIVGGYRLDVAKYGTPPDLERRPPVIGFIGKFTSLSPHDGDYGLHLTVKDRSRVKRKLSKISAQVRACAIYSYLMHALIEQTDFTISLRPHHNEYPHGHFYTWAKKQFGDRVQIDDHLSFYEWAASKMALITTSSSTFAEVTVSRTPLICIDHIEDHEISLDHHMSTREIRDTFQGQWLPKSFDEIFDLLQKIGDNFEPAPIEAPMEALMKEQYMWPYEGSSLRAIADGICDSLETMDNGLRQKRSRLPKWSGDVAYAIGMAHHWIQTGRLRPRFHYVYNDHIYGRDGFYKKIAARIERDKSFVPPVQ